MKQNTNEWILGLLGKKNIGIILEGKCHDCEENVSLLVDKKDKDYEITGGCVWKFDEVEKPFFKCMKCLEINPKLTNFQPTEVYSRVVGYLRPVKQWNKGKQEEFKDRKVFKV